MNDRWRYAAFVGAGCMTALVVALALQVDTFFAPLLTFTAMQPHTLSSWGRMARCIWISGVAVILAIIFGGLLLQVPWLLLPCLFAVVSAVIYSIPLSSGLLEALAILPPTLRTLYVGVFAPQEMGHTALSMWAACAIGVTTATVYGRFLSPVHPREELASLFAAALARGRAGLASAGARFRNLDQPVEPPPAPESSELPARLQLLDRARQEGISRSDTRALLALMTAVERSEAAVEVADALARQPVGTTYRSLIDAEVGALLAALDQALAGYEGEARRLAADDEPAIEPPWPDVLGTLAAVEDRQLALRRAGAFAPVGVDEAAHVNSFVAQLRTLSYTVRISPQELERMAAGDPLEVDAEREPGSSLRVDPYAARFAMKCGLATVIAFQIPVAAGVPDLFSLIVAPFLVAQTSYGATIEKAPLRLLGVVIGGMVALLSMMTVMVNTNDVGVWAATVFAVTAGCMFLVLRGANLAFVFTQVVVTFLFVTVAAGPTANVTLALWRAVGNFVGGVVIVTTFRLIAPDYAGRQLIARLRDLLGDVLALLPRADGTHPPLGRAVALHRDIGFAVADLLRLVAEARLEGTGADIDPTAAVEAAGLAQRIAYRLVAICRAQRLTPLPPLPESIAGARAALRAAVREHVDIVRGVLAARHTNAPPGSFAFRRACAAAVVAAARPRPDLTAALHQLVDALDRERTVALADWPPAATGALFAELQHFHRIVDLLPSLESQVVSMCVFQDEAFAGAPRLDIAALPVATR